MSIAGPKTPMPITLKWADVRRSIEEVTRWNESLPKFVPPHVPPAKPKPARGGS